jgi:hypothetical protein
LGAIYISARRVSFRRTTLFLKKKKYEEKVRRKKSAIFRERGVRTFCQKVPRLRSLVLIGEV